jgi:hypothetical protein
MTHLKNEIRCLPKAVNLTFEIQIFIWFLNFDRQVPRPAKRDRRG